MLVEVYRNLNKKCWSIRHKGRVIAHASSVIGYDGDFIVREGGRQKAVKESQRNIHAFCKMDVHTLINPEFRYDGYDGIFNIENNWMLPQGVKEVTYNPFKDSSFVTKEGKQTCIIRCPYLHDGRYESLYTLLGVEVKLATVRKLKQVVRAMPEKTLRIQTLEVSSIGYFKLNNGQTVKLEPSDIGKSIRLETDMVNPLNQELTFI